MKGLDKSGRTPPVSGWPLPGQLCDPGPTSSLCALSVTQGKTTKAMIGEGQDSVIQCYYEMI